MINPEKNCHGNRLLKVLLVVALLVIKDLLLQFGPHAAKANYSHSSQQQGRVRRCAQASYTKDDSFRKAVKQSTVPSILSPCTSCSAFDVSPDSRCSLTDSHPECTMRVSLQPRCSAAIC